MIILFVVILGFNQIIFTCQPDCAIDATPTTNLIRIDGILDEEDWSEAMPARDFFQATPLQGRIASFHTKVRILHDQKTLYVGATLTDPDPHLVQKTRGRNDRFNQADWFLIALDSNNDRHTAFYFAVNAAGVRVEGFQADGEGPNQWSSKNIFGEQLFKFDQAWDAEWSASARVDSIGWTVEMAIPISLLEIMRGKKPSWGVNFRRWVPRKAELSEWALISLHDRNEGEVRQFGTLQFMEDLRPTIHRFGYAHATALNYAEHDDTPAFLPFVGASTGVTFWKSMAIQASVLPELIPEDVTEYIDVNFSASDRMFDYDRLSPISQSLISSTPSGPSLIFDRLRGTDCIDLVLGGASLNTRLPHGVTATGITSVNLATVNESTIPLGFTGRIQKDIGDQSMIGVSATHELVSTDSNLFSEISGGIASAALMDWDLRTSQKQSRWSGQVGISRFRTKNYCQETPITADTLTFESLNFSPTYREGIAARVEFGQFGKAINWFSRMKLAHPDFVTRSVESNLLLDQIEITTGFRGALSNGTGIIKQGQWSAGISQRFQYTGFSAKETILFGVTDVLTSRNHMVSVALHTGVKPSGYFRFGLDASISSDNQRRIIATPRFGMVIGQNDPRIMYGSLNLRGAPKSWFSLQTNIMSLYTSGNMGASGWLTEALLSNPVWTYEHLDMNPSVQCIYGFRNVRSRVFKSSNCLRAYLIASVGVNRKINFEIGVHGQSIGVTDNQNLKMVVDGITELIGGFKWKFKTRSIMSIGVSWGRSTAATNISQNWNNIFQLITVPSRGDRYYLLSLTITRRWQR